jgi:hypothetical protein
MIKDVMTEADTFKALKRTPFEQMHDLWLARLFSDSEPVVLYDQHGWTSGEFWIEYYKRLNVRNRNI